MFTKSFHTHTTRCRHAEGEDREYVLEAVKSGMTVLGFSDHSPYVFEGDYDSGFRMRPEEAEGYFASIQALKQEFAGQIEIHTGFEAEYYPRFFPAYEKLLSRLPAEYLLLGQHFLFDEIEKIPSGRETDDETLLKQYVNQVSDAMKTGMFACVAHPDCFRFAGSEAAYEREMTRLCENALLCGVPLEINLLGIRTNRHYPNPAFWRIAGRVGNTVVCGSDAHAPKDVCDTASYEKALAMAAEYGLKLCEADVILKGGHTLR